VTLFSSWFRKGKDCFRACGSRRMRSGGGGGLICLRHDTVNELTHKYSDPRRLALMSQRRKRSRPP
jgi:hypothetical protein